VTSRNPPPRATVRPGRPRGPRRDRDERRGELLDAAERAIRRIGPRASMDELAAEAGITKPILYSHFGDKAGLVAALSQRVAEQLNAAIVDALSAEHTEPRQAVASTIAAFCTFIESEPELYRFMVQAALQAPRRGHPKVATDISNHIAIALGSALRRAGADSGAAEPWAFAIVGMTLGGANWWLERRSMSKDDLVDYLTQLLWSGLSGAGLARPDRAAAAPEGGRGPGSVTRLPGRSASAD
jgi:AcrR family transcriptional regulator